MVAHPLIHQLFSKPAVTAVAAGSLFSLALAHSILGESRILRPLFADKRWRIGIARRPLEYLLRGAWHMTSLAWVGLAAAMLGAPVALAVAGVGIVSGVGLLVGLRGHLAWPLFIGGGLASLDREGQLPPSLLAVLVVSAGLIAAGAAAIHLYWAAGGRRPPRPERGLTRRRGGGPPVVVPPEG
ncbi:MAG: hypothetical protein AAGA56_09315, partial [Myxococcota bacterium]